MKRDMNLQSQQERDAEFARCENAGMSATQIAEHFNVTTRTVQRWRTRLGLNHCPPAYTRPATDRERAEYLLDQGCSFADVARTVGVDRATIYRWFPDRQPWSREQVFEYRTMVRQLWRAA